MDIFPKPCNVKTACENGVKDKGSKDPQLNDDDDDE